MVLASRIEAFSTLRTTASAVHILIDAQDVLTHPAKHCSFISLVSWPYTGLVGLLCIVTADAGVELLAAKVLDGDDV